MTSFVLFPQASEPIMNLYISKLVYYEVRKYEIMSEAIEEHMVKSFGWALIRLSPQANQLRMMEHYIEMLLDVLQYINHRNTYL